MNLQKVTKVHSTIAIIETQMLKQSLLLNTEMEFEILFVKIIKFFHLILHNFVYTP